MKIVSAALEDCEHHCMDVRLVERIRDELERRRPKPRPEQRPPATESRALKAMRRSRRGATEPALRQRLEAAIARLEAAYRPGTKCNSGTNSNHQRRH